MQACCHDMHEQAHNHHWTCMSQYAQASEEDERQFVEKLEFFMAVDNQVLDIQATLISTYS